MNRVAEFKKVSKEEFLKDFTDTFPDCLKRLELLILPRTLRSPATYKVAVDDNLIFPFTILVV